MNSKIGNLALLASQLLDPPASAMCIHMACFGAGLRLVQILGASFAKF